MKYTCKTVIDVVLLSYELTKTTPPHRKEGGHENPKNAKPSSSET